MLKVADLIEANIPELARLEALQAGKSETFASMEFGNPVEAFRCSFPFLVKFTNCRLCRIR